MARTSPDFAIQDEAPQVSDLTYLTFVGKGQLHTDVDAVRRHGGLSCDT
jgi:hypothetical protein